MFGGIALATGGSKAKKVDNTPPINASSKDEENFIKYDPAHPGIHHLIGFSTLGLVLTLLAGNSSRRPRAKRSTKRRLSVVRTRVHNRGGSELRSGWN